MVFNQIHLLDGITIPLHTDRLEMAGGVEKLLAAGERGRSTQRDRIDLDFSLRT
jgi:hypothetical protein